MLTSPRRAQIQGNRRDAFHLQEEKARAEKEKMEMKSPIPPVIRLEK
jgi:hypothetical protein